MVSPYCYKINNNINSIIINDILALMLFLKSNYSYFYNTLNDIDVNENVDDDDDDD